MKCNHSTLHLSRITVNDSNVKKKVLKSFEKLPSQSTNKTKFPFRKSFRFIYNGTLFLVEIVYIHTQQKKKRT